MITLPAIFEKWQSLKDRTYKLIFASQELTPQQVNEIAQMTGGYVYMGLKLEPFKQEEEQFLEGLQAEYNDTGKSPAQRLRGVFYRLWEQNSEGYEDFNRYYDFKMEQLIKHFKSKLP